MNPPLVTVIMPVYNAAAFLRESIDSILNQTFKDFEFFIIDDASTDESLRIINEYSDNRISVLQKEINTGYTDSLNMAIACAKGKFIARMDADDIAMPDRFTKQLEALELNPALLVCGTAYKMMGKDVVISLPADKEEAKIIALMNVPVGHPTVMMRAEIFSQHGLLYNKKYEEEWKKKYLTSTGISYNSHLPS